ncbi:type IV inositol polyphosphate 5-phosphatase 11 [Mercurialis annua]|uniref:type IV inositol polyphosphate 5-phosphatase 11 n=1 Tax=Mercurialis annua TaxID=3986 RepID=UPI0021608947|nr:type IV inositol polyphosphate 5-phosphatase 11 [Mercurialis annua]
MGNCSSSRSKIMRKQMDSTMSEHDGIKSVKVDDHNCDFSRNSNLCICIITWNMNGKVCYQDLVELVGSNRKFDLLVVGFQEAPRENIARLLQTVLLDTHKLVRKVTMQSLQLYVFGPLNSGSFIKEMKVDKHAVGGLGGLIRRTKGAVAIYINYKGIPIVFISCHLSAHARNVEERNRQCRHISRKLFSRKWNPYAKPAQIIVWLGDLNYRIQGIDTYQARSLIQHDLQTLLTGKDQLLQEAERGQVFNGYSEGILTFKPTYKYNIGTGNAYDTSYKVRVPSWTDRILFKIDDVDKITATLHSYDSIDDIYSSDHKPVKAHLCFNFLNDQQAKTVNSDIN